MKATLLILAGLPGSGKTTAAGFFKRKSIPVIRMGEATENQLRKEGKKISEKNEYGVRKDLRKTYGEDIYARLSFPYIEKEIEQNTIVVVEGLMSLSEKKYFENRFSKIKIVFIQCPKDIRFNRLRKRNKRPLTYEEAEKRDHHEIDILGKLKLEEESDTIIINTGSREEFYHNLEEVLREIENCI